MIILLCRICPIFDGSPVAFDSMGIGLPQDGKRAPIRQRSFVQYVAYLRSDHQQYIDTRRGLHVNAFKELFRFGYEFLDVLDVTLGTTSLITGFGDRLTIGTQNKYRRKAFYSKLIGKLPVLLLQILALF